MRQKLAEAEPSEDCGLFVIITCEYLVTFRRMPIPLDSVRRRAVSVLTDPHGQKEAPRSAAAILPCGLLALLLPAALVRLSTAATDTDSSQEQVERPSPPLPPSPSSLEAVDRRFIT